MNKCWLLVILSVFAICMRNTLEISDNYLERAMAENLNIMEVLDHIFLEEEKSKRRRAYEKQILLSGFPIKKTLGNFDFSFQPSIDQTPNRRTGHHALPGKRGECSVSRPQA